MAKAKKDDLPSKRNFWSKDLEFPKEYLPSKRLYPCPKCRRIHLDNGGQNSILQKRMPEAAIFYCKSCGHKWILPRNQYVFPKRKKLCDICKSETMQYSTQGNVQYRKCVNDSCKKTFQVVGKKIT